MSPPGTPFRKTPSHNRSVYSRAKTPKSRQLREATLAQQYPSYSPGSASKIYQGSLSMTGWTPLISRAFNNDHAYNSTPLHQLHPATNSSSYKDLSADYIGCAEGLSLTPFLNSHVSAYAPNHHPPPPPPHHVHNRHFQPSSVRLQQPHPPSSSLTPVHDRNKSIHLTDFFIDSPIRDSLYSGRDAPAITPSRFTLSNTEKLRLLQLSAFHSARILNSPMDLLARYKRIEPDPNKENLYPIAQSPPVKDSSFAPALTTPSKLHRALRPSTNQFITPCKEPAPQSSPLTVLMSSAAREAEAPRFTPCHLTFGTPLRRLDSANLTNTLTTNNTNPTLHHHRRTNIQYASPTPHKVVKLPPRPPKMGVFSEKRPSQSPFLAPAPQFAPPSDGGLMHSLDSMSIAKRALLLSPEMPVEQPYKQPKKASKSRMQAGMNKFQIVISTFNNQEPRRVSKKQAPKLKRTGGGGRARSKLTDSDQHPPRLLSLALGAHPLYSQSLSSLGPTASDYNTTLNSSKELSMFSVANNSVLHNTSHVTTSSIAEHSSFDLGGVSSTPNHKFIFDKVLDKPCSPHNFNTISTGDPPHYFEGRAEAMAPSHPLPLPPQQQHKQQQQQQQQQQFVHPQHVPQPDQQLVKRETDPQVIVTMSTPQRNRAMAPPQHVFVEGRSPDFLYQSSYNLSSTPQGGPSSQMLCASPHRWVER